MDDEQENQTELPFRSFNSDNVVNSTELFDPAYFGGPEGESRHAAVVEIVRKAMAKYEEEHRERAIAEYEKQMIVYATKKAEYDEATIGCHVKVLGALADDFYPDEIQGLKPEKPTFYKWPLISADRVKMAIFPETNDHHKAVKFYVTYDS
jgi:hypothetical protein